MPIAEWESLTELISLEGSLPLNDRDNTNGLGYYLTSKDGGGFLDKAASGAGIRSTGDPVPQAGGTIWHRGFENGYLYKIPILYYVDANQPANAFTTPTAQQMDDRLMKHLRSIISGGGRLVYNPQGLAQRIGDSLFYIADTGLLETDTETGALVQLGSEYPYMIDFTQITTTLTDGSPSATLDNTGSAPFYPVFQVFGPFDDFTLTNTTTDKAIIYDSSLPGAVPVASGDYIEITTFRNTVYLNGSGAARKAGIDLLNSEFFTLDPGDNTLTITSTGTAPNVNILWQAAWA